MCALNRGVTGAVNEKSYTAGNELVRLNRGFFPSKCYSTVRRLFVFSLALRHHVRIPLVPEPPSVWNLRPVEKFDIPTPKSVQKTVWRTCCLLKSRCVPLNANRGNEGGIPELLAVCWASARSQIDFGWLVKSLGRSSKANKRIRFTLSLAISLFLWKMLLCTLDQSAEEMA